MSDTQITGHYQAAAVDASMIGAVLGNYRITDGLSAGGMGSVYRAQHTLLGRPAAIKLLRPELTESDELVQRFFNEAKAATEIRHPGIVEVYDFGYTDDGHAYLVMEFLDGSPLSSEIAARGRFSELEAASIARGIASALKAAHAKRIIHRDLKPDNIFLIPDPDGRESRVKVLDFGIAKLQNPAREDGRRHTQSGVLMGTPKYMAPEQAREAATIDQRADLYSLGCILYELLVGIPPFLAEGAGEIIALQLFSDPEPPSRLAAVSKEMEALVLRLLAKDPNERYQSATELMDALVAFGVRMSGTNDAISLDSKNNIKLSSSDRARLSRLDTLPAISSAEITTRDPEPPAMEKRASTPFLIAGLALAIAAGTVAFFLSRDDNKVAPANPVAPEAEVVAPPPSPPAPIAPIAPIVEPEQEPEPKQEPVAQPAKPQPKKPAIKTSAKIRPAAQEAPVASPTEAAPEPPKPPKPTGPTTEKGSPIESTLDDSPKKTP